MCMDGWVVTSWSALANGIINTLLREGRGETTSVFHFPAQELPRSHMIPMSVPLCGVSQHRAGTLGIISFIHPGWSNPNLTGL